MFTCKSFSDVYSNKRCTGPTSTKSENQEYSLLEMLKKLTQGFNDLTNFPLTSFKIHSRME